MIADRIFGLAVTILALLFMTMAIPAIDIEGATGSDFGYYTVSPRAFPYVAGGLCVLLGGIVAIRPDSENRFGALKSPAVRRSVSLMLGVAIVYVAALDLLGFTLSSVLALGSYFVAFGERRWALIATLSIGVPLAIAYAFSRFCLLDLPVGRLMQSF